VPKVHNKPIQDKRKGSYKRSKVVPKVALVWRTELSSVPPDNVRCTRESNSELAIFGNSESRSAKIHWTCPVLHRSNGYFAPTVVCRTHSMRYSACQSQSSARRRTGQCTVTVRCTTGLSGDPKDRSSNGRTLMVG
jgi:hypothetical protein